MPIALTCECGRSLRVKDDLEGRKVRCPECQHVLAVARAPVDAEDEAVDFLLQSDEERPPRVHVESDSAIRRPETAVRESTVTNHTPLRPAKEAEPPQWKKRPPSKKKARDDEGGYSPGIAINPEILAGAGMMLGAVVWFALGMAAGYIYFYPPVLFCLGIGAIIRGFTGKD